MYKISLKPKKVPRIKTKYRVIKTAIPSPSFIRNFSELSKYEPSLLLGMFGKLPVCWDRAVDFQVFDQDGNCWIDFTSTIFVANAGHANPLIISALKRQLAKPLLHSFSYVTEIKAKFLKKLIEVTPAFCQKALLFSAGTEATEAAFVLMKAYGQAINKNKVGIISFKRAMHGVTMAPEMMRGDPETMAMYGYSDPTIHRLPFPYPWVDADLSGAERFKKDISELLKDGMGVKKICGFMIEAYQGWGAIFYPPGYIEALADFARKNNILICFDDIQAGFGRTGKFFAYQHYGVEPDLICTGKGMSSSLPLSAVIGRKSVMEAPIGFGATHSTHSGNPLSCAAGLANIEAIEKSNLIQGAARKGKILFSGLNEIKASFPERVSYVLGRGLIVAILFKNPKTGEPDGEFASRVCERAMQKGLLMVHTGRESIKIAPPLTIPDEALREGVHVLEESIEEINAATSF